MRLDKALVNAIQVIVVAVALAGCKPDEARVGANSPPPSGANSPPVVGGSPGTQAIAGTPYSFTPWATDSDGDTLTFSASGLPAWATINAQTGSISGTPSQSHVGMTGTIIVSVTDGRSPVTLPGFRITVFDENTSPPVNLPPSITGSPPSSVAAGSSFNFAPTATDPEGGVLAFSILQKPTWATFSTTTGQLTGIAQTGVYNISITVTDIAGASAQLAFVLTVSAASSGSAALSWSRPTENTDGSALTDLAGYLVYHGRSASSLTDVVELQGADSTMYTFSGLASGEHYFAVAAFNAAGLVSAMSAVGSKTVP